MCYVYVTARTIQHLPEFITAILIPYCPRHNLPSPGANIQNALIRESFDVVCVQNGSPGIIKSGRI